MIIIQEKTSFLKIFSHELYHIILPLGIDIQILITRRQNMNAYYISIAQINYNCVVLHIIPDRLLVMFSERF